MLVYVNHGERRYDRRPVPPTTRRDWEFQAIVAGSCEADLSPRPSRPAGGRLWLFRPETPHGWRAEPGEACRIAVAHFDRVPAELDRATPPAGWLSREMDEAGLSAIEAEVTGIMTEAKRAGPLAALRAERLLIDLSLSILEAEGVHRIEQDDTRRRTEAALAWYGEHLADRPTVRDVAEAVYVSPGHLRRLFREAGIGSPQSRFKRVRIDRSRELLERTDMPVKTIAHLCGFASASDFSRSCRRELGAPPSAIRIAAEAFEPSTDPKSPLAPPPPATDPMRVTP